MSVTYPASFVDGEGIWWVILRGHDVDRAEIEAALVPVVGECAADQSLTFTEEWFSYSPRVKWCSRFDGWGCDQEGDWHGHWFPVQPNADAPEVRFTIARWITKEAVS